MSNLAPIICDNGTGYSKVGFAGNSDPSFVFPTAIATKGSASSSSNAPAIPSKPGHLASKRGVEDLDFFIGDEALANAKTPGYGVHYPIRHGMIDNWDHMERYWEQTIFKYLRAEPEDHYFLLTEPPLNAPENREQTAEIFFESFNIQGLYIAVQAVLALAASWSSNRVTDRTLTGTVIDSGDGVTHVIPCAEGYVIGSAIKHIPIAGRDISQFVLNLMRERGEMASVPPEDQLRVASKVKENYSYVCQDIVKEFRKYDAEPYKHFERYEGEHTVTGRKYAVDVGYERFLAPEIFFNPEIYSSDFLTPLPEIVDDVIKQSPIDVRRGLYKNIVLSGGSTMFQHFGQRLKRDLKQLVDRRLDASVLASGSLQKSSGVEVDVISHKRQRYAVWFGGSLLASLLTKLSSMSASKSTISALPLAPPTQLLTHNLTPDPRTPSALEFRTDVLATSPSIQRRARLLAGDAHFSYVTPFPVPFPYSIEPPSPSDVPAEADKPSYIEKWLAAREPRIASAPTAPNASLCKYIPELYDNVGEAELLGISETALRDCVPHLDVGDAFTVLGTPELSASEKEEITAGSEAAVAARKDLIEVLSGRAVLMSDTFAPWSVRYSGHQFGSWAGQLGDGRATSILVTANPENPELVSELQLKGSGRTPFSRSADGLAVTRSSVREYLCSEAMHALGIPTTRALALISLPGVPVLRETVESACVLTRVAPSFLRIGSFEALSPPQNIFLFGGGQQAANWDALRLLGIWVARTVLKLPEDAVPRAENATDASDGQENKSAPWGKALVLEVARRNARMVAGWQAYGFMHGVINTDNVSVLGLTIDYGPYAFMDVFDPFHICNHTDEEGRYAYRNQPSNVLFAIRALHTALATLIGAESELGHAVPAGWANAADKEQFTTWRTRGMDELKDELERVYQSETSLNYAELMRKRLALRQAESTDEAKVVRPLLDIMTAQKLDFHGTFRTLTAFRPVMVPASEDAKADSPANAEFDKLVERLLSQAPGGGPNDRDAAKAEWREWLNLYARRIEREATEWGKEMDVERARAGRASNPRFVLRQWLLQEVIGVVEKDSERGRRVLAKVLHMASNPFESWGGEDTADEAQLDAEEREERRFCGFGSTSLLGFQCSCSS
ncbi:hypothetical protein R3P38DRAFT_2700464 [Favolaschia claudopus]|uniref:Selenoprotein O n=1 Tax=Favolaschia claudopus TaxID=2862362 RepID=A0AAW0C1U8_9AGAR